MERAPDDPMNTTCHGRIAKKKVASKYKTLIQNTIQCPVCMEVCFAPVTQCVNGHVTCNQCMEQLKQCPVCKTESTGFRASSIEKLADNYLWACCYADSGCNQVLEYANAEAHKLSCQHRPVRCCPLMFCKSEIKMNTGSVIEHMVSVHGARFASPKIFDGGDTISMEFHDHQHFTGLVVHSVRILQSKGIDVVFFCIETHYEMEFHFVRVDEGSETKGSLTIETTLTDTQGRKYKKTELVSHLKLLFDEKKKEPGIFMGNCLGTILKKSFKTNFLSPSQDQFGLFISIKRDIPLLRPC